jgi:hypothetical protein
MYREQFGEEALAKALEGKKAGRKAGAAKGN